MTDARTKQVQEIEGLLAERRKYEQWLAQLEARKESTPGHVFEKVHHDYTARLGEAQQKLSSESGAVHALAAELDETLAGRERQIAERTDERAEAELRASVGEFAGKEWDKLRGKLDSAIADLSGERDGIKRELETLRALLSEAEPASDGAPKRDVDDIAFLRSVLGRSTPYASAPANAAAPPITEPPTGGRAPARAKVPPEMRPSAQVARVEEAAGEAEPAPAVEPPAVETPRMPASARASDATTARGSTSAASAPARQSVPELFATPEVPEEPGGPRGTDDMTPNRPSGTFGMATPGTTEAVKSLKCQECGTLNHPTEWYCERCGGELAAF